MFTYTQIEEKQSKNLYLTWCVGADVFNLFGIDTSIVQSMKVMTDLGCGSWNAVSILYSYTSYNFILYNATIK